MWQLPLYFCLYVELSYTRVSYHNTFRGSWNRIEYVVCTVNMVESFSPTDDTPAKVYHRPPMVLSPPHPSHPTTLFGSITSQSTGACFTYICFIFFHLQYVPFAELTGSKRDNFCHSIRIRPGVRIQCSIDQYIRVFYRSRIRIRAAPIHPPYTIHTYIHLYGVDCYSTTEYMACASTPWPVHNPIRSLICRG